MSNMPSIPTTPLIYVDTNGILSAKEYGQRGGAIGDSSYRTRGRNYEELFELCMTKGFRVTTHRFALTEMLSIYQRWSYAQEKIRQGVPFDEVLGKSRSELERAFYTQANLANIVAEVDTWLTTWRFRSLVELYPDDSSPTPTSLSEFWEVTRIIFRYAHISAPDCLHAAATVVMQADLFVSNDQGLNKAVKQLYDTADFRAEVAPVLGFKPADILLPHGALRVQTAVGVVGRLRPNPAPGSPSNP